MLQGYSKKCNLLCKRWQVIAGLETRKEGKGHKKSATISETVTLLLSSGSRTRTCDLRVMSPTSYLLLYPAILIYARHIFRSGLQI